MRLRVMAFTALSLFAASGLFAAGEHCPSTYLVSWWVPALGAYHTAAKITDPAGEQTALFDLSWGGELVSLNYLGTEYVAAPNTIAGSQVILRTSNYTPTMGGDSQNRGSLVTGAACSANHLWLTSNMTDYNAGAGTSTFYKYANNQWYFDQLMAPYIVSTHAYFVPNPAGTPHYYLKIDRTINNIDGSDIDGQENFSFTFDLLMAVQPTFATYAAAPYCDDFWSPCYNTTPSITAGFYSAADLSNGIAMTTFPATQWSGDPGYTAFSTESLSDRNVLHFNRYSWSVSPQTSKTYSMYVMVGPWTNASSYAAKVCNFSVSKPPDNVPVGGTGGNITITTNSGCSWEATTDVPWISLSQASGSGSSTITYTVGANSTGAVRVGNLNVAGRILPLFQQAH